MFTFFLLLLNAHETTVVSMSSLIIRLPVAVIGCLLDKHCTLSV